MRYLRAFLGVTLTLLLGVMLLATIYFTLFDLQWIAFLAGVLFAAVSATASQASKAQWLIARRTRDALAERVAPPDGSIGDALIVLPESGEATYLQSMTDQLIGGNDPRAQLVRALQEEDQFILFAQTIQPLSADAPWPRCFEVLLRLMAEERHMAPPGGFILVAERYNLTAEIDRWVVRNLLKWCAEKQRGSPAWRLPLFCVNLATASLCEPEFALYVRGELQRQKYPAANLCFEIAEPDAVNHHAAVRAFMNTLRPFGCRFTLDAFGSTKVSFAPLRGLTLDFLKIDGVIIQNLLQDPAELARARAIVLASRKTGLRTIAEFVESGDTFAKLREIGVDYAQGFGIGKPGPIAQVS